MLKDNVNFGVLNMKDFISLFPKLGGAGRLIERDTQLSMLSAIIPH